MTVAPEECIDFGDCIPECPVAVIFEESDVPEQWKEYTAKNAEPFKNGGTLPKAPTREKWEEAKKDPASDAAKYYQTYPPKA